MFTGITDLRACCKTAYVTEDTCLGFVLAKSPIKFGGHSLKVRKMKYTFLTSNLNSFLW
jgi:hypothetical protein